MQPTYSAEEFEEAIKNAFESDSTLLPNSTKLQVAFDTQQLDGENDWMNVTKTGEISSVYIKDGKIVIVCEDTLA